MGAHLSARTCLHPRSVCVHGFLICKFRHQRFFFIYQHSTMRGCAQTSVQDSNLYLPALVSAAIAINNCTAAPATAVHTRII